jgi:type IV pilus assembly protein PilA
MLARIRKMQEENEGGFTLIELLVVIIIIGILAAIAIPVFLNQRKKGYDAAAKSDIRNAATLEETYLTDNNVYADTANLVTAGEKNSANVTNFTVVSGSGAAGTYVLGAVSASGSIWCYDSSGAKTGVYKGTGTAPTSAATGGVTAAMCA